MGGKWLQKAKIIKPKGHRSEKEAMSRFVCTVFERIFIHVSKPVVVSLYKVERLGVWIVNTVSVSMNSPASSSVTLLYSSASNMTSALSFPRLYAQYCCHIKQTPNSSRFLSLAWIGLLTSTVENERFTILTLISGSVKSCPFRLPFSGLHRDGSVSYCMTHTLCNLFQNWCDLERGKNVNLDKAG